MAATEKRLDFILGQFGRGLGEDGLAGATLQGQANQS